MLSGLDLTVPNGTSLAIVGQNGAGKTTLAKLLCRFYDPTGGAIMIDGVDLRSIDLSGWHRNVGAVFQDFIRFELSLRENVDPGRQASDNDIRAALADAGAEHLAELDVPLAKGYSRGIDLSGGQWQRIALARALCAVRRGARLVLLDEPTAHLDVRGEAEVFDKVLKATHEVTAILISHRFSTVRQADRICVLEHGRVIELGATTSSWRWVAATRRCSSFKPEGSRPPWMKKAKPLMSSRKDELPPALSAMWRLCKIGYTHEPLLVVLVVALTLLQAVPDALFALWLKLMADALLAGNHTLLYAMLATMAVSATLTWLLRVVTTRQTRRFRDRVTIVLETHVATLQASVSGLELQERQDYLDRLAVLRNQVFVLDHMYVSLLNTIGWIVRIVITVTLLMTIDPRLVLLVFFALPTVLSSAWRPGVERQVEEQFAQHNRLAEHLFATATSAAAAKEIRVTGIGRDLADRRRAEWQRWFAPVARARWGTAISHSVAWAIFGLGYVGAVVFVVVGIHANVGSVLLILAAGARLSSYVGGAIGEIGFLRGFWIDGSRRLAWLENYSASQVAATDAEIPTGWSPAFA